MESLHSRRGSSSDGSISSLRFQRRRADHHVVPEEDQPTAPALPRIVKPASSTPAGGVAASWDRPL